MIKVQGLKYSYGATSIDYPDFQIQEMGHFSILGNSGSGKTTLLHLMSGIKRSKEGTISVSGTDLTALGERERDKFRGSKIGLVFQQPHLLSALTVKENLLTSQFFSGQRQELSRVREVLKELDIEGKMNSKPNELSQGEAQRVAIARAVINKPEVIMADEPTSSLDDDNCQSVLNMLIREAGLCKASLIVVTHDQRVKSVIGEGINLNPV